MNKKKVAVLSTLVVLALGLVACGNTAHVDVEKIGDHELAICVYHTGINAGDPGSCQLNDVINNAIIECSKAFDTQPVDIREPNGDRSGTILVKCGEKEEGPAAPSSR